MLPLFVLVRILQEAEAKVGSDMLEISRADACAG